MRMELWRLMQSPMLRNADQMKKNLVISSARFLAPVTITPPPQTSPGQTALGQGTAIQFQLLTSQAGQLFFGFAAFLTAFFLDSHDFIQGGDQALVGVLQGLDIYNAALGLFGDVYGGGF